MTRRQLAAINATAKAIEERDKARAEAAGWKDASDGWRLTATSAIARADELTRILAAVDALHTKDGPACACGISWPCPTRRALDGGR
jgi:hypothetical protein